MPAFTAGWVQGRRWRFFCCWDVHGAAPLDSAGISRTPTHVGLFSPAPKHANIFVSADILLFMLSLLYNTLRLKGCPQSPATGFVEPLGERWERPPTGP